VKRVYRAGLSPLLLLLLAVPAHAQSPSLPAPPPVVGFVSPYEIMRTLRGAGLQPLSPPLREGTNYVLRATDFRGILMHVVVDARTAAIRDVTRIVPGPGQYSQYGQYYGNPAYGPDEFNAAMAQPTEASIEPSPMRPLVSGPRPIPETPAALPPLPRPRPATLVSGKSDSIHPAATPLPPANIRTEPSPVAPAPAVAPPAASGTATAKPIAPSDAKAQVSSEVVAAPPPPASAPAKRAPLPVEPLND
jgi:hypothetical protein